MTAWLFDVDGVLTNPQDKTISPEVLSEIIKRLKKKEPVAVVTGRSSEWLKERLMPAFLSLGKPDILDYLFISGEFGGVSSNFKDGKEKEIIDDSLSVPREIVNKGKDIAGEYHSMFFDSTKKTMVSIEMNDGYRDMDNFKQEQKKLGGALRKILDEIGLSKKFEVQDDTIATNIRNKKANKGNSASQVLNWLRDGGINPDNFICFGDSISDLEMGQKINDYGFKIQFVFVGKPEDLNNINVSFPIVQPKQRYDMGTLKFLKAVDLG